MKLQHNMSALNAHRNLGVNNSATAKNLEKLASGYRVNRAADDAAGLAISEKMRGQIRGLDMAEQNTDNAISLIKTAEGGLNETHAILHRMRELAVQASNGTYQDDDRQQIQLELQALKGEIDRIAGSTHFNGINLLDGTLGGVKGYNAEYSGCTTGSELALAKMFNDLGFIPSGGLGSSGNVTITSYSNALNGQNVNLLVTGHKEHDLVQISLQTGGITYTGICVKDASQFAGDDTEGNPVSIVNNTYVFMDESGCVVATLENIGSNGNNNQLNINKNSGIIAGIPINKYQDPTKLFGHTSDPIAEDHPLYNILIGDDSSQLIFQIGANGSADQRVGLHVPNTSTAKLGTMEKTAYNATGTIAGISLLTRDEANDAIDVIDVAVQQISAVRANLGALQNRLEHTLNNLGVTKENLTAAESTIRDVDMAKEMMEFTKNNILVQASQAMLAQANALPQGILSLLQ